MTNTFATKLTYAKGCLDESGIGHNLEERLRPCTTAIAKVAASVVSRCHHQLHYDQLVNVPTGIAPAQTPDECERNPQRILMTAMPGVIGEMVTWDICQAREFCFSLLEDVNDHETAAAFHAQYLAVFADVSASAAAAFA